MPTKTCELCGKEFYTKSSKRKICYDKHYHPCPICGKDVITTGTHYKRLNTCCCSKHSRMLAVKHIKDKYAVWPTNSDKAREKRRQTCLDRYGVENPYQSEEIKDKIKQTCIERYGVDNIAKSEECTIKKQQTCLARYGVTNAAKTQAMKDKIRNTIKEKYGIDSGSTWSVPEVREKQKQTCIDRYGVDNPMKHPVIKMKCEINKKMLGLYNIATKKCKLCGKDFKPTTIRQMYCDNEHFAKCEICGKEFKIKNKYHVFKTCSKECNRALFRKTIIDRYGVDNPAKI